MLGPEASLPLDLTIQSIRVNNDCHLFPVIVGSVSTLAVYETRATRATLSRKFQMVDNYFKIREHETDAIWGPPETVNLQSLRGH